MTYTVGDVPCLYKVQMRRFWLWAVKIRYRITTQTISTSIVLLYIGLHTKEDDLDLYKYDGPKFRLSLVP